MLNLSYAWIPLIISFIAGTFALHQIKSNNITNARIKWLENLKQIIAEFLAECNATSIKHGVSKAIALKQLIEQNEKAAAYSEKIYNGLIEDLKVINLKHDLIKLNLNPKELVHQKFEEILNSYMAMFNKMPSADYNSIDYKRLTKDMDDYMETLLLLSRFIIKIEWEKTKRSFLSKKIYFMYGNGKKLINEALNLPIQIK